MREFIHFMVSDFFPAVLVLAVVGVFVVSAAGLLFAFAGVL